MSTRLSISAFALFLLLGQPVETWANDAPVRSVGKTIQPLSDVPVQMVAEEVNIYLTSTKAHVQCFFTLQNQGGLDTIEVGFPRGWEGDLLEFKARDRNAPGLWPVRTMAEYPAYGEYSGEAIPWWKVFEVPFAEVGDTVVVENRYHTFLLPWGPSNRPLSGAEDLRFTYILKTGALWQGAIRSARITVRLGNLPFDQITGISPEGYSREGNRLTWSYTDFEPTEDIKIDIMQDALYERTAIARRILAREPDNAYAHYLLGTVLFNRWTDDRHLDRAEEELRRAIELDPVNWDARWFLAAVYTYKDRPTKSLKNIRPQLDAILQGSPGYRCTDKLFYHGEGDGMCSDDLDKALECLTMNGWH